jgi:hypothetical protein
LRRKESKENLNDTSLGGTRVATPTGHTAGGAATGAPAVAVNAGNDKKSRKNHLRNGSDEKDNESNDAVRTTILS